MNGIIDLLHNGIYKAQNGVFWLARRNVGKYAWAMFRVFDPDDDNDMGIDRNTHAYMVMVLYEGIWTICVNPGDIAKAATFDVTMDWSLLEFTGKRRPDAGEVGLDIDPKIDILPESMPEEANIDPGTEQNFRDIMSGLDL